MGSDWCAVEDEDVARDCALLVEDRLPLEAVKGVHGHRQPIPVPGGIIRYPQAMHGGYDVPLFPEVGGVAPRRGAAILEHHIPSAGVDRPDDQPAMPGRFCGTLGFPVLLTRLSMARDHH